MPATGPRLEPALVGEQHHEILAGLKARFVTDESTGRQRLRPGAGGFIALTGKSGTGKSRIVRELYRHLRSKQSQPGYWPALGPDEDDQIPRDQSGLAAFAYRKVLGPPSQFRWPPSAVPDFLWWSLACQRGASAYLNALDLAADDLLQHREPALFGWSRAAAGSERWARSSTALLKETARAVGEEPSDQLVNLLEQAAGATIPFGGLIFKGVKSAVTGAASALERRDRFQADVTLGDETGARSRPVDDLLALVRSLTSPKFPLVVVIEDLHDADRETLELLAALCQAEFVDRVLIVATAWPEGLTRRVEWAPDAPSLGAWLTAGGAVLADVDRLPTAASRQLVLDAFPDTPDDVVTAIVERWETPLALGLVVDLLDRRGRVEGQAIVASLAEISKISPDMQGLYDAQFTLLPEPAQLAVILDIVCGMDAATAGELDRVPGPAAQYAAVETSLVSASALALTPHMSGLDHPAAVSLAWLSGIEGEGDELWVVPREPGFAVSAWNALNRKGLNDSVSQLREHVAEALADRINTACSQNGVPGLFITGQRRWLRECSWMLHLGGAADSDPTARAAAARASLELFRHLASVRPQEATRQFAPWFNSWESLFGPDHPSTLTSRNDLANAFQAAGDLRRAIALHLATLKDRERVLGPNHPDTLTSRNNLALSYRAAGDLRQATALHLATLKDRERVLGPNHPDTLTSRNNLAYALRSAGELGRAVGLYEATLTVRERVLGRDHPQTLNSRNNLAIALQIAGDLGRAVQLHETTLRDRERILGPDHPQTLLSRNNLGITLQAAGALEQAIPLFESTLTDRRRILGPDHPHTLTSSNNLANAYQAAGDVARAISLHEATLKDRERILGPEHPHTLTSRNHLATALQAAGNLEEAIHLHAATLMDRERILGADHPQTLTSRNNLASAFQFSGNLARAIPLYQATLTDRERILGPDHPGTLNTRHYLSDAYCSDQQWRAAADLLAVQSMCLDRLRGPGHAETLSCQHRLSISLWRGGHKREALRIVEEARATAYEALGPEHELTQALTADCATMRQQLDDE